MVPGTDPSILPKYGHHWSLKAATSDTRFKGWLAMLAKPSNQGHQAGFASRVQWWESVLTLLAHAM